MSWQERLLPGIVLVSPEGEEFIAKWKGDPRNLDGKVPIFEFPYVIGSVVQDLGATSSRWPLSILFDGPDHDLTAEAFFKACQTRGKWTVQHPTKGLRVLQFLSVSEDIQPVDSANLTAFKIEAIEPLDAIATVSPTQLAAQVHHQVTVLQEKAAEQFSDSVNLSNTSALARFQARVLDIAARVRNVLDPITKTVAEINAQVESVYAGIVVAANETTLSLTALGGQLQTMVTLPGQIETDLATRIDYYKMVIGEAFEFVDDDPNTSLLAELIALSAISTVSSMIADNEQSNRDQAIGLITGLNESAALINTRLDERQAGDIDQPIEQRYYNQVGSYNDSATLYALTVNLLLRRAFDLAVARRMVLKTNRAPVEIALTEDVDLDLLIASNGLKGDDILLLPAGREVVIYS